MCYPIPRPPTEQGVTSAPAQNMQGPPRLTPVQQPLAKPKVQLNAPSSGSNETAPSPAASTPAPTAATLNIQSLASPQTPKSPKTKAPSKAKAPTQPKRRMSKVQPPPTPTSTEAAAAHVENSIKCPREADAVARIPQGHSTNITRRLHHRMPLSIIMILVSLLHGQCFLSLMLIYPIVLLSLSLRSAPFSKFSSFGGFGDLIKFRQFEVFWHLDIELNFGRQEDQFLHFQLISTFW